MLEELKSRVIEGDAEGVKIGVQKAIDVGMPANEILNGALIPAMREVGERFENGDFFVPEMLIAAHAMQAGLALLKPLLAEAGAEPIGKIAIGTVKGDLHDIGKNLVAMMCEGEGFEIIDLGVDVSAEKFVEAAKDVHIVAMSALLTTTMPNMKSTIEAIRETDLDTKIMVGGAPVTQDFADQIGADGFSQDAASAARLARSFIAG